MLTNATLLRIDRPTATAGGDFVFAAGPDLAVRCCLTDPTQVQRWTIDDAQLDATDVAYLDRGAVLDAAEAAGAASGVVLLVNARLTVQPDGEQTPTVYQTRGVKDRVGGTLSHFELILRAL